MLRGPAGHVSHQVLPTGLGWACFHPSPLLYNDPSVALALLLLHVPVTFSVITCNACETQNQGAGSPWAHQIHDDVG